MEVYRVWVEWIDRRGERLVRDERMFGNCEEAMEWYTALKNSFVGAQGAGMVKSFTMHLAEEWLEV